MTTVKVRLGLFPDRFTMIILPDMTGKPITFTKLDHAQHFIMQHDLPKNVSPVEVYEDPATDPLHISHAITEVLKRLN